MKYFLGLVLWYWLKEMLEEFYQQVVISSVDVIYFGEVVCSKCWVIKVGDWLEMVKLFVGSGKQIVFFMLVLVQALFELGELKCYVENGEFLIEVSDFGVVNMCVECKLLFVVGHVLNCYNVVILKILFKQGMMCWCMLVEFFCDWLVNLFNQCDELGICNQFEVEVLSYGYLLLVYFVCCFIVCLEDCLKDECEICCIKYLNGCNVLLQEN